MRRRGPGCCRAPPPPPTRPRRRCHAGPAELAAERHYDIEHLTGDLVALLDHYGYADATFVGHDWGAFVVWGLTLLHPNRVTGVVTLSVPYQERGEMPRIEFMEAVLGTDFYFVHFNRQPGVADAVFEQDSRVESTGTGTWTATGTCWRTWTRPSDSPPS